MDKFKKIKESSKAFQKAHDIKNYNHIFSEKAYGYEFKVYNRENDFAVKVGDDIIGYFGFHNEPTIIEILENTQTIIDDCLTKVI